MLPLAEEVNVQRGVLTGREAQRLGVAAADEKVIQCWGLVTLTGPNRCVYLGYTLPWDHGNVKCFSRDVSLPYFVFMPKTFYKLMAIRCGKSARR